jgi:nucleoside phosphorylase
MESGRAGYVMRLAAARDYTEGRRGLLARRRALHVVPPKMLVAKRLCGGAVQAPGRALEQHRRLLLSVTVWSRLRRLSRHARQRVRAAARISLETADMPLGVQICSSSEWTAAKEILAVPQSAIDGYPYGESFRLVIAGQDCVFFNSRRTKVRAAGACQWAIDRWQVNPLLVLGTCGGVAEHLPVMSLIVADRTFQYDSRDLRPEMGYMAPADLSWLRADTIAVPFHIGTLATADRNLTFDDLTLLRAQNVLGADWESGAIATVCMLNAVRWAVVRAVSDVPLKEGADDAERQIADYRRHTPVIMEMLLKVLPAIIAGIAAA